MIQMIFLIKVRLCQTIISVYFFLSMASVAKMEDRNENMVI